MFEEDKLILDKKGLICHKEKEMDNTKFEEWAILELMGHRRLAGKITDAVIGGGAFLRIDIPMDDDKWTTQYYSPQSVYCISPVSEELARMVSKNNQPAPVHRWEFPQIGVGTSDDTDPDDFPY